MKPGAAFIASLPERTARSLAALLGGTVHEAAALVLPRLVRRSRLFEATAKNALRIAIEFVGGVKRDEGSAEADAVPAKRLAVRKSAGNVVEVGSIAAFGFSPLWLLAAAADVLRGSRVYLQALVAELKLAGILAETATFGSVDELLGALEGASGGAARLIDIPPLELAELRTSLEELRGDAKELPTQPELDALYQGLRETAGRERRSMLEVSSGVGLAFLLSAGKVGRRELVVPYQDDWRPIREEGFAAYGRRVARPYAEAIAGHFDRDRPTLTERGLERLKRDRS